MEDEKTVRELHTEAMNIMMEALVTYHTTGWSYDLRRRILEAYVKECEAAERFEPIPENEPTRSILYRSAAILGLMGGEQYIAKMLAGKALEGTPQSRDRETLLKIVKGEISPVTVWKI